MSLIARALEAEAIPTMVVGSARDIMEAGRPPRAAFVDYPLGHTVGKPFDQPDQQRIVSAALDLFERIENPGDIRDIPALWDGDEAWRDSAGATEGSDTRQPRDTSPQFQFPADREAAISAGTLT